MWRCNILILLLSAWLGSGLLSGCNTATISSTSKIGTSSSRTASKSRSTRRSSTRRASTRNRRIAAAAASVVGAGVVASQLNSQPGRENSNFLLGNPSNAGTDPNNFLVSRPQHVMSYNRAQGGPNWVSWHLDSSNLGTQRRGNFMPDPLLPPDMQIRPNDYRGSGYDRGHVCPSGDRTASKEDNDATFVMSNMLPQAAALNQQVWKDLEEYERYLTESNELYIIAGGNGSSEHIAGGKVNVLAVCWKILGFGEHWNEKCILGRPLPTVEWQSDDVTSAE